jgi:hypothetical protein
MFDDSMVRYEITAHPEDTPIEGNVMASGCDAFDKACENKVRADYNGGNYWAWCGVQVSARYDGVDCVVGNDYLGGCSYASEEEFKADAYYEDMKDRARDDLYMQLEGILYRFGCINPREESV